ILPDIPTVSADLLAEDLPQYLYSPRFPLFYIGNYQQAFHIRSTANRLITLQILSIDLCCMDHVDIFDGASYAAGLLVTLERHSKPTILVSSGQDLYIHMDLMHHWNCSGVLMKYTEGSSHMLSDDSGTQPPIQISPPARGFSAFETEKDKDYLKFRFFLQHFPPASDSRRIYQGSNTSGLPLFNGSGPSIDPVTFLSSQGFFLQVGQDFMQNTVQASFK
ncbi:hypothetical protein DPMN_193856, partial [Dreissena polymorpha]